MKFKPMLAASEIPSDDDIQFPLLASYKLDGIRCLMVDGQATSRKMLPIPNQFCQSWAAEHRDRMQGLDGELIVGEPCGEGVFARSTSGMMTTAGEPDFTLYVFEDWSSTERAVNRHISLRERLGSSPILRVELVEQVVIRCLQELKVMYAQALALGYEGLILKHPHRLYKNGRSTAREGTLLKWKEWADSEALILGLNQGTENTNELQKDELGHAKRSTAKAGKVLKNVVGSFQMRDIYTGVEFNCSTGGLTEQELVDAFNHPENWLDKIAVYKFQKSGVKDKPRFPGYKALRDLIDIGEPRAT